MKYKLINMKYKLINMKCKLINILTKEEHLCSKVVLSEFEYYYSDKKLRKNDIVYSNVSRTITTFTDPRFFSIGTAFKVIATNNPNSDLPQIVTDFFIEDNITDKDVFRQ